ncbi:Adenylate kinase isoenzyme 1 [Eufriesea mexicana]|uniref:adenylate kinase isoenzyme 1-like n=1 Tax=Eufriesea mexicana TaxID=516756 RepID=UPI00083BB372|nr:PREDICTED: adenylate kinase isoenzyme 1-like [Eufriesea mexicana]OAD59494.1 Adenylate kinase isoenzyme 1 [Eufriesea mexicana]
MGNCWYKDGRDLIPMEERVDPGPLKYSRSVIIFVIGGPGVGKSTLCKKLATKYGLTLIWVSNILREEVASGSDRGNLFKAFMEKGAVIPAAVIVQLVVRKMLAHPNAHGYLIVGFPRNKKQAVLFNSEVRPPSLLINLYARRLVLQDRMARRASAGERFDDTAEAVCNRVINYFTNVKGATAPNKAVMKMIDAENNPDEVYNEVAKLIEETLSKHSRS